MSSPEKIDAPPYQLATVVRLPEVHEGEADKTSEETAKNCYKAADANKNHLVVDSSTVSFKYLYDSKIRSELSGPADVNSSASMPLRGIPSRNEIAYINQRSQNNPRIPLPNSSGRNQPHQPPRNQTYVYYPRDQQPYNTRDTGPYRLGRMRLSSNDQLALFNYKLRKRFVFRVYLLLTGFLSLSFGTCLLSVFVEPIGDFFRRNWWLSILFMLLYIVVSIPLTCVSSLRRSSPINYILLFTMCLFLSLTLCTIAVFYSPIVVLLALGTTVLITFVISMMAKICPCDVTGCGMLILILSIAFMIYSIITIIVSLFVHTPLLHLIYGAIGTMLYSFFLFYDTQQILGGRRIEISPEEYVLAVIILYLDIVMIFLLLLNIYDYSS